MASVGILITGNEVLFGKTRDTNGPFLAKRLQAHGHSVTRLLCCGDDPAHIQKSLDFLSGDSEIVLMTGGLGPTRDDLTSATVATYLGMSLEFSQPAWDICISFFQKIGRKEIPETNRKQAMLPAGARVLGNELGTAAGFDVSGENSCGKRIRVVAMPGVPLEMEAMFENEVLPVLTAGRHFCARAWHIFQVGESVIQERLARMEEELTRYSPQSVISYQAHQGYVTWSVSQVATAAENEALLQFLEERASPLLRESFGAFLLYEGLGSLTEHVVQTLGELRLRLALAESCTGGLIAREITTVPNASLTFMGAAVTYSNESKVDILGVDFRTLDRFGAVSPEVAHQMAHGARLVYSCDIALSVTGVAGPGGGTIRHPVGCVCFGLSVLAQRLKREAAFIERMAELGWRRPPPESFIDYPGQRRTLELVSERQFGQGLSREAIQRRSMIYCLGTLAATAEFFR